MVFSEINLAYSETRYWSLLRDGHGGHQDGRDHRQWRGGQLRRGRARGGQARGPDVHAEEVERGGDVELGRGVRHLRHLQASQPHIAYSHTGCLHNKVDPRENYLPKS